MTSIRLSECKSIKNINAKYQGGVKKVSTLIKGKNRSYMDKKLKSRLDRVFSEYVRLRDLNADNSTFVCISCGMVKPKEQMDAGHFWNRVHLGTRWDERNVHGECRYCNRFDENHLLKYREHLEKKIGADAYNLLEYKKNGTCKFTDFELKYMIDLYKGKIKDEKRRRGIL